MIHLILMLLAVICFGIQAFAGSVKGVGVGWLGLLLWAFSVLLQIGLAM